MQVEKEEEEELADMLLDEYNCVVVFLDAQLLQHFYHGFCRTYLRPIFHCQSCMPQDKDPFSDVEWRAYCTVNKKFAEKVIEAPRTVVPSSSPQRRPITPHPPLPPCALAPRTALVLSRPAHRSISCPLVTSFMSRGIYHSDQEELSTLTCSRGPRADEGSRPLLD